MPDGLDSTPQSLSNLLAEKLVSVGFCRQDRRLVKLELLYLTQYTDKLDMHTRPSLQQAVHRWHQKSGSTKLHPRFVEPFPELPDLEKDPRFARGLEEHVVMSLSIELYNEMQQRCPLPLLYAHVKRFCASNKHWTKKQNAILVKEMEKLKGADLDLEGIVQHLMTIRGINTMGERLVRSNVVRMTAHRGSHASGKVGRWTQAEEEMYRNACKRAGIDYAKGTMQTWADVIMSYLHGKLPRPAVLRRLTEDKFEASKKMGVKHDIVVPPHVLDPDNIDEDENPLVMDKICEQLDIAIASEKFNSLKREGPSHPCASCGQLQFMSTMTGLSNERIDNLHTLPDIQAKLTHLRIMPRRDAGRLLCSSCNAWLLKNRLPTFCFGQNLPHRSISETVSKLTDLEADLVSPQIAFARVVQVQWQKQKRLKGAVVNVPADFIKTVEHLPRTDMQDFKQFVDMKRDMKYKSSYRQELIGVKKVREACAELCTTPLYKANNIAHVNNLDGFVETVDAETQASLTETGESGDDKRVEKDLAEQHTDERGNLIVEDDADLYEDEEALIADGASSQTMLDLENNANELRQSILRVAPASGQHPQGILCSPHGEELCFPRLFGGHARSGYGAAPYSMIARHELRSRDRRFAHDASNIFFKMRKNHCQTVCGVANMAVRRAQRGSVTAGQLKNPIDREHMCMHDVGYLPLTTLRTSPDYKDKMKKDIFAMIQQLGKPCWFVTLTCGSWDEMLQILYEVKHEKAMPSGLLESMTSVEKAELIAGDPVTCARHYHRRATKYIETMIMGTKMLGKVIDHAGVDEFTAMGNPHTHLLLWADDSPTFNKDCDEEIVAYVDEYVTTDVDLVAPALGDVQRHKHTRRCGGRQKPCSFGFPKPPMSTTMLLHPLELGSIPDETLKRHERDYAEIRNALRGLNVAMKEAHKAKVACPEAELTYTDFLAALNMDKEHYIDAIRSSIERPTIFYQRRLKRLMINPFNKNMLETWRANIDVQHILNPWAATMYVASYISKSQRGLSTLMRSMRNGEFRNASELVRRTGATWINTSEISVQEAVYHVLGLGFRRFSRQIQFLNTNTKDAMFVMAKRKVDLDIMDDEDTDCFQETQQDRYAHRRELLGECMADFYAWYSWNKSEDDSGRSTFRFKKRERPKVLRWVGQKKNRDMEAYCREQVMLFCPWHNDFEELLNEVAEGTGAELGNWPAVFAAHEALIRANRQRYRTMTDEEWDETLKEIEDAAHNMNGTLPADEGTVFGHKDTLIAPGEASDPRFRSSILHKQNTAIFKPIQGFAKHIASLNEGQHQFFDYVMQKVHEHTGDPICTFLSGGAGVGKTHVVYAIAQAVCMHFNYDEGCEQDNLKVLLLAPTGKAAFNIGNVTIHHGLSILSSNAGQIAAHRKLSGSKLIESQSKFRYLKMVIVDEISMLSSKMLEQMNDRLQQIMNCVQPFGGLHLLLVGDLYQLQPVGASWIFNVSNPLQYQLWRRHVKLYELTEIMRQKDDKEFAELLNRLRIGKSTAEDERLLQTRHLPKRYDIDYIFPTNPLKDDHNSKALAAFEGALSTFSAQDKSSAKAGSAQASKDLEEAKAMQTHQTCGLPYELKLKQGVPVELTTNVNVNDGLCNGSDGHFKVHASDKLWVKFKLPTVGLQKRSEPLTKMMQQSYDLAEEWIPVDRISKDVYTKGSKRCIIERKQYPVVLAFARTVHHSQGSTYKIGGVDMGKDNPYHPPGMHYVALARYTQLKNVWLHNFSIRDASVSKPVIAEMERMSREAMLDIKTPTLERRPGCLTLFMQNVRSFRSHAEYICGTRHFRGAPFVFLQETCCSVANSCYTKELQCLELPGSKGTPRGIAFLAHSPARIEHVTSMQYDPSALTISRTASSPEQS